MQIIVRGHKLKITPAIRNYAQKKMQKMERFFSNIQEVLVELEVQHIKNKAKRQIAHVTIKLSQGILRGNESDQDIYTALDKIFAKMEKQVKKHHEKLKTRRGGKEKRILIKGGQAPAFPAKPGAAAKAKIIIRASNPVKPMEPKEAVLEFNLDKNDLFVFKNPYNGSLNILYKLEGEGYGLYYALPSINGEKKGWLSRLFASFRKKEDPTFGESSIKEVVGLGRADRMSPPEALEFMKNNNWRYYVFQNTDTRKINVLYPLTKERYGLIESRF